MKQTITYRETRTLEDTLRSCLTVNTEITPEGLIAVKFCTYFTQSKRPGEPRINHTLYCSKDELTKIITVLQAATGG